MKFYGCVNWQMKNRNEVTVTLSEHSREEESIARLRARLDCKGLVSRREFDFVSDRGLWWKKRSRRCSCSFSEQMLKGSAPIVEGVGVRKVNLVECSKLTVG